MQCTVEARVRAVSLAREAREHREAGRLEPALETLREAWRTCPDARLRLGLGRVLEDAGRSREALQAYQACVDEGDEAMRRECTTAREAVAARLSRGTLVVVADAVEASVLLDDASTPRPPGTYVVAAGRHGLTVRAPGHVPFVAVVDVPGDGEARVEAVLAPIARAPALAAPVDRANVAAPSTAWHWVGVVGGGLLVAGALPFFVQDALDRRDARGASATYSGDHVSARNLALGCGLAGVGAATALTAALLWPRAPAVAVAPVAGGVVVAAEATW